MTTYYKGNNIGLNYDAANATWSFNNLPQDFIDTSAFSTPDPAFQYAPPTTDDTTTEQDPCPPGYIYDNTLKQCVPDPNYQNPFTNYGQNTGNEKDESEISGTGKLMPQIPEYQAGVTGARAYVPQQDISGFDESGNPILVTEPGSAFDQSGIDYGKIFPYATTARTRAQMNEHMLIAHGLDNGWIAFDDEKNAYRKIQFQEQINPGIQNIPSPLIQLLSAHSYGSYKDYFEILEKGWQPSSDQNVWKKWIQGNAQYSLTGGMIYKDTSTRGGRTSDVTYVGYSKDRTVYEEDEFGRKRQKFIKGFETKIKEAMAIPNGIIDRDGNVNVRGDSEGGYYNSEGRYINADGSSGGNLVKGIQYLFNLEKSGLKLPDNLKKRLIKGINTKALSYEQRQNYAELLGYNNWNDVVKEANNAIQNSDTWTMADVTTDVTTDVKKDDIKEDKTPFISPPSTTDEADVEHPTYGDKGSYGGGEDFGSPKVSTKPQAPPGQPPTGPHYGYGGKPSGGPSKPDKPKTCFHPEQLIGNKFIKDLEPGDLINGTKILGMVKLKLDEDMYSLNNVRVTGTHKVKYNNTWMYVSNHPESFKINDKPEFVYVPIVKGGTFIINNNEFADYDDEHIETLNNKLKVA